METMVSVDIYDVVICGGGLAGLTLARQIKRELPHVSMLVIEGVTSKSLTGQKGALNVGESTIELSAYYLADILGLREYLHTSQFRKMGLRFFFYDGHCKLQDRPEFGTSGPSAIDSFQLDRALLEEDLKRFNNEDGIPMITGCKVEEILLAEDETTPHTIRFAREGGEQEMVRGRWVIDAMGRRRYLQKKLGVIEPKNPKHSSAWFRVKGRISVCDLVPRTDLEWHNRVPDGGRYFSTNHLMSNGRWVWLIPLATGYTSIGIVAHEDFFPFSEFNTYERTLHWLEVYEPDLWQLIRDCQPTDFQCLRHYSYPAKKVFSHQRWACTGDAAVFSDPFLSPGIDQAGFANTIITEMIRREMRGELKEDAVETLNHTFVSFNSSTSWIIQQAYPFFGEPLVMGSKLLWDFVRGWTLNGPQRFNRIYLDAQKTEALQPVLSRAFQLTVRMEKLFKDWAACTQRKHVFTFMDYFAAPGVMELYLRNLKTGKTIEELISDHQKTLEYLEELVQVIFLVAITDVMPEALPQFPTPFWINAWGIGLDQKRWKSDRLFTPTSEPRTLKLAEFSHYFGDIKLPLITQAVM